MTNRRFYKPILPGSIKGIRIKMKEKISISVDGKTLDILDESVLKRRFRNRSHAFEYALIKILEELKDGKNK